MDSIIMFLVSWISQVQSIFFFRAHPCKWLIAKWINFNLIYSLKHWIAESSELLYVSFALWLL